MFEQQVRELERLLLPSNKASYEREKESLFASFRRSCLNVSDSTLLQTTPAQITAIWRLLLDVARSKLRRKHVLECARILTRVGPFLDLLLHDPDLDRTLRDLPQDFVREIIPGLPQDRPVQSPKYSSPTTSPARASPPPALAAPAPAGPVPATATATAASAPRNRWASNPFDPSSDHRVEVVTTGRWWEGDSDSPLLARAREIAANQERILRQQAEILQRTRV